MGECPLAAKLEVAVARGFGSCPQPAFCPPPATYRPVREEVESGVAAEIAGLAPEARPGLAQVALCLGRMTDNPEAVN